MALSVSDSMPRMKLYFIMKTDSPRVWYVKGFSRLSEREID